MTFFDSCCGDGVSIAVGDLHKNCKSVGESVTLFDSYCDDGVSIAIGVQHTSGKSGCRMLTAVTVMMV